jgi:hypothetical protein
MPSGRVSAAAAGICTDVHTVSAATADPAANAKPYAEGSSSANASSARQGSSRTAPST